MDARNIYTRVFFREHTIRNENTLAVRTCNDLQGDRNERRNFYSYLYSVVTLNDSMFPSIIRTIDKQKNISRHNIFSFRSPKHALFPAPCIVFVSPLRTPFRTPCSISCVG